MGVISNSVFNLNGGSLQSPLLFDNSTLNIAAGVTLPGSFTFQNVANALNGQIAAQQTVRVLGGVNGTNGALTLATGAVNAGTIWLDSVNSAYSSTLTMPSDSLLVNDATGSIQSLAGTDKSQISNLRS